jgi:hypothetical protein
MEWSLCLTILKLQRWLVCNVISILHSVGRRRLVPSARPQIKCRDGLPLSVMTILRTTCTPNIKWSGWNMMRSTPILSMISFSLMFLSYSKTQSKRILFPNLWAHDRLSSTSTKISSKLSLATWCIESRMKLIDNEDVEENLTSHNEVEWIVVLDWCQATVAKAKERVLLLFKWTKPNKDGVPHLYTCTIPKTKAKLFHLTICYVLCGTSFHMVANIINCKLEILFDPFYVFALITTWAASSGLFMPSICNVFPTF